MDEKKEQILQIVQIMRQFEISIDEIETEYNALPSAPKYETLYAFDLLMKNEQRTLRVPFRKINEFKGFDIVGIFPFKERNFYLKLEERKETKRDYVYEPALPSLNDFQDIFLIRHSLNKALRLLQKPVMDGYYFAKRGLSMTNIIVYFDDVSENMLYDTYDRVETAKARYCDYILCERIG